MLSGFGMLRAQPRRQSRRPGGRCSTCASHGAMSPMSQSNRSRTRHGCARPRDSPAPAIRHASRTGAERSRGPAAILDAERLRHRLHLVAGNKAANLAEVALLGEGAFVPPWFVVTDSAFRERAGIARVPMRGRRPAERPLRVVESIVARPELTNAQQASLIRQAWERRIARRASLTSRGRRRTGGSSPSRGRTPDDEVRPFVAVRSSASEEDLEAATRAGEFDTFLFVRGRARAVATSSAPGAVSGPSARCTTARCSARRRDRRRGPGAEDGLVARLGRAAHGQRRRAPCCARW